MARQYAPLTLLPLAAQLPQQFPQVEAASMVREEDENVERAGLTSTEAVYWADPNLFRVLPLPRMRETWPRRWAHRTAWFSRAITHADSLARMLRWASRW